MYTVFLIDGDKKILKLNKDVLQWYKYHVMEASSATEAEELLSERVPDLIVLGDELSDGDGLEYCKKLKERYRLPVVLISKKSSMEDEIAGLKSGADDYMVKPYSIDVFEAKIAAKLRIYHESCAET